MSENFMRTYEMKCGPSGESGFQIGNIYSNTGEVLHIAFSIEKSSEETPNDAKVQIWNLSDENLKILESKDCIVELKAGYGFSHTLVLVGSVSSAITTLENADRMTELEVVDGLIGLRDTVISVSLNGKVNTQDIYQYIAEQMGISIQYAPDLRHIVIQNGFSFVGKAADALTKIADCCGHQWSIQNGVLQITLPGRAISSMAYQLSAETGLINIPKRITIGSGAEEKTGWEVEYLLNGAIGVNDIVEIESSVANGYFLVYKVTIDGDNLDGDWICTAQVLKISENSELDKAAETGGAV